MLESKEITNVECASYKSHMFGISILGKLLQDATKNKSIKNLMFNKKGFQ